MKQMTYTITGHEELLMLVDKLKTEDYFVNAKSRLLQIFEAKTDLTFIQEMLDMIRTELPDVIIAGLTTCAEICNGRKQEHTTVFSFCFFEESDVFIEEYDCSKIDPKRAGVELGKKIMNIDNIAGIQVFATSSKLNLSPFIEGVAAENKNVPLFGSGAGSYNLEADDTLVFGKHIYENGIIAVIFAGSNLHIKTAYNLGWLPVGKEMEITEINGQLCVSKIDEIPAISVYEKYLNVLPDKYFVTNTCEFPITMKRSGKLIARLPLKYDDQGRLYFASDIHKGEKIRLSYGNPKNILRETLNSSRAMIEFDVQALFLYACKNREAFLKKDEEIEIEYYKKVKDTLSGCYAYAEIMKNEEGGGVLNSALIAVGMREGDIKYNEDNKRITNEETPILEGSIPFTERLITFLEATTTELKESNKMLEKMATLDGLTKVYNRRKLEQIIEYEIGKRNTAEKVSVILLDIDNFKRINDTYGHDTGDYVLKRIIECVKPVVRQGDSFGRWGGEEFLCVFPDATKSEACIMAERVREKIEKTVFEKVGTVTVSIGVTTVALGDTLETIFNRVDKALYEAKNNGKNRVEKK